MTTLSVAQVRPDDLLAAASRLRHAAQRADELTLRLAALDPLSAQHGWTGLAALQHSARLQTLREVLDRVSGPGEEAAGGLERCAVAAEHGALTVRRWRGLLEQAEAEQVRLRTLPPTEDPAEEALRRRRWVELEGEVAGCVEGIRRAEEEFSQLQHGLARRLEQGWVDVSAAVDHVRTLVEVGQKAWGLKGKGGNAVVALPLLAQLVRSQLRRSPRGIYRARTKALAHLRKIRSPGGLVKKLLGKLPPGTLDLVGKGSGALTVIDAGARVVDGGGYDGWRAGTTRTLAVGAVVGVPLALVSAPAVAIGGTVAIGAYTGWITGNWIYDNRGRIGAAGKAVSRSVRRLTRWGRLKAWRGSRRLVELRSGLRIRAKDLVTLGGLTPELPGLRRLVRKGVTRLRLPDPARLLPRLPVVPPVTVAPGPDPRRGGVW